MQESKKGLTKGGKCDIMEITKAYRGYAVAKQSYLENNRYFCRGRLFPISTIIRKITHSLSSSTIISMSVTSFH
jgi:hypothetical protein